MYGPAHAAYGPQGVPGAQGTYGGPQGAHGTLGGPGVPGGSGGHDTYGSHGHPAPDPAVATMNQPAVAGTQRRKVSTLVLVVILAALVGGGGVAAMLYADEWGSDSNSSSSSDPSSSDPSSSPSSSAGATDDGKGNQTPDTGTGGVPDGWERVDDPQGFSLVLPKGWQRQVEDTQVDYTPDNGEHFVRIAVDDAPDFDTPYTHLLDLEEQLGRLQDYRRVGLEENTFRDRPGALWDFTWTALPKDTEFPGPRRAIEQAYLGRDGVEYVIYMSAPAADWDTAKERFDTILRSWRPPGAR
jgi:hypothetical protein